VLTGGTPSGAILKMDIDGDKKITIVEIIHALHSTAINNPPQR
jgi:hypothetical protein